MTAQSATLLSINALPDDTDTLPSFNGIEFAIVSFFSYDAKRIFEVSIMIFILGTNSDHISRVDRLVCAHAKHPHAEFLGVTV